MPSHAFSLLSFWNLASFLIEFLCSLRVAYSPRHSCGCCWVAVLITPSALCVPLYCCPERPLLTALPGCHLPGPSACWRLSLQAGSPFPPLLTCSRLFFFPTGGLLLQQSNVLQRVIPEGTGQIRNLFKPHEKQPQTCLVLFGFSLVRFLLPDGLNQGWKCPRFPDSPCTDSVLSTSWCLYFKHNFYKPLF